MPAAPSASAQLQLAVFVDFENLALGLRDGDPPFDVRRILDRLLEKGKVIAKVAYADWSRFRDYTTSLHESGIELIEIPRRATTGKNSADIRLVVDAMDLSWSKPHIDTFVIVSGDSDFSPLVAKLKENGKHVIGLGMKASTSPLLANGCDEFVYYEDLDPRRGRQRPQARTSGDSDDAFRLLADTVHALRRENHEVIQASLVKDTLKRKRPAFSEGAFGYGSFSDLLEDAEKAGVITLRKDERSGTYLVDAPAQPERPARSHARTAAPHALEIPPASDTAPPAGPAAGLIRRRGRARSRRRPRAARAGSAPARLDQPARPATKRA
jgi:NYN domain-containing protein